MPVFFSRLKTITMSLPADQFSSGLVANLYENLNGELPSSEPNARFLSRYGTPALKLGCGSGLPSLDLLEEGFEVDGLDASRDILEVCQQTASKRGLSPLLHHGLFQSFNLSKQFTSIYVPSASITLLTSDVDALATLKQIHRHLMPSGALFCPWRSRASRV
jgi:2-polyprenyl-3-methyl-5-hydroxy-6-metoxy-1,4-benzoquinol methylase